MQSTTGRYRALLAVVGVIAMAVVGGAAALWPRGELARPATAGQADSTRVVAATLTRVAPLDCARLAGAMDRRATRGICRRRAHRGGQARPARAITTSEVVEWMRLALALAAPSAPEHHPQVAMATCS
jgi:hypothetical protein